MKNKILLYILGMMIFCRCSGGSWDVYLCAQKIEGSSKIIYKYDAWGGRDSQKSGYAIVDSSEVFDINKIDELPISYFTEIPNRNSIYAVEMALPNNDKSTYYKPIKTYKINEDGIDINIKRYQYKGFSEKNPGLRGDYKFTSFKETRDSLFFYSLDDTESMEHQHVDSLKFKKTNVTISQTKSKEVLKIEMENLMISKNNTIISVKTYFLKPKRKINSDKFSNYGIFKQIL